MALLEPYSKIPEPNTATILLVENEEKFQAKLADAIVQRGGDVTVNVRLACRLPLPAENRETRPRVDLVVFIVNLLSERSVQVVESSLNYLRSDFFLGKVCFMVIDARCSALAQERLLVVKKLAASHHCPVICVEHQLLNMKRKACRPWDDVSYRREAETYPTEDGVNMAASRLLTILKVSAGLSPVATTALYMSALTRCTVPSELEDD